MTANKLLDHFGYKKGKDGWRTLPDGKPLVLRLATEAGSTQRELDELWQKSLASIGIRMETAVSQFVDNVQASKACKLQMWGQGWIADYPDGDNFVQLLYGPNVGQSNPGCYESKAFDKFYEASRLLPNSPERNLLFLEMTRQMEVDAAWSLHVSRVRNEVDTAVDPGLQEAPDPAGRLAVSRRRRPIDPDDASCFPAVSRFVAIGVLAGAFCRVRHRSPLSRRT